MLYLEVIMTEEKIFMRKGNNGLTVKVNLWPLEKYLDYFDSESARLWIKGSVTNADTKKQIKFNDAGELITILGRWNRVKLKQLQTKKKKL
jgi:CRISPR/Cas system-associated endonuclease Cas3-HD